MTGQIETTQRRSAPERTTMLFSRRSKPLGTIFFLLAAWTCQTVAADKPARAEPELAEPAELHVLFLGDRGHHLPADRAAQLIPVLAGRGIDVTYTEDVSVLDLATLEKYDALIVYANIEKLEPSQEQALLDYVAQGGGFVPLHCASYCFLDSPRYIALVGAQFQSHGTGEFDVRVVDGEHPIMQGLAPFRTWDETYVHHRHNEEDRHVLQVRPQEDRDEPWTWVRTHGKGRVFYTAYGHDHRTWAQPGFQALVERGIRWAAGQEKVFDGSLRPHAGLPPFEYEEAALPNYLPGRAWGTQGEPIGRMQLPVEPAESQRHLALPQGFRAELFAAEPEIAKPLCMAWDHRGRLWIAESVDYPNELQPPGKGRDRIRICEDADGDGRADKFTVFADELSIPTGLLCVQGGLLVQQAPHTLFLPDADGDDRADEKKILLTGWNTGDTHAGPSNLRLGFDNWIYGMVGYSGFQGTVGGERVEFRTGFYRFRLDGSQIEFLRNTNNNSWGVGFSEEGLLFGSTANGCPSVYLPIPNRYYEAVRGWTSSVLGNTAVDYKYYPITDKVRQVDWHGGFTAAAGHALYTAREYPRRYWNRTAFVCEPTGHLTATFWFERRGSDFVGYNAWNLVASDDEWTAPIAAEVGPDGQVWMIDWYNYIVQHNPTPEGFKTGQGNAYETPLRDKTHGRIYRLVYEKSSPRPYPKLSTEDPAGLVQALAHENLFWRQTAQHMLVARGKADVARDLIALVDNRTVDAIGLNPGAIHALWALHALGKLDGADESALRAAIGALRHPSAGVRRNALFVLPRTAATVDTLLAAGALEDADAHVRLAALLTLAECPAAPAAAKAIVAALVRPENAQDRWIPEAATAAAAANDVDVLAALATLPAAAVEQERVLQVASRVAEHFARQARGERLAPLAAAMSQASQPAAGAVVAGLAAGWPKDAAPQLDEAGEQALAALLERLPAEGKSQLIGLAGRWDLKRFDRYAVELAQSLLVTVQDRAAGDGERLSAARQLIELRKQDAAAPEGVLAALDARTPPELAVGWIDAVAGSEAAATGPALVRVYEPATPAVRAAIVRALLSRADWAAALLDGVEQGKLSFGDLALDRKQSLAMHPEATVAERAKRLLASGGGLPDPDRQKAIDQLADEVLTAGDAGQGKEVFKKQCAKCHTHSGEGTRIGPDLTGMAVHPKREMLIHILDPSRSVEGNYRQYAVTTLDGRVFNGLLAAESKTSIELIDVEGKKQSLPREDIDELAATKKSLMPEGFEKQVEPRAIRDLLEFLARRGKYLPLDLGKVATIVSTRGMFYSENGQAERLIFDDWSPKTFEGVPFLLVDPDGDRRPNVVLLHGPVGEVSRKMPKAVTLPCNAPVKAIHLLSGVSGWGYAGGDASKTVSLIVRLHYADGEVEDRELKDGVHFADYIRQIDVPESKMAFKLRGRQIRYLAVHPARDAVIAQIELVKGPDHTAPVVMAVTVEPR